MLIDLRNLLKGEEREIPLDFDYYVDENELLSSAGVIETAPIAVAGRVIRVDHEIYLELSYDGTFVFGCSRCLESANHLFKGTIEKRLSVEESDDPDVIELMGKRELQLEEVIFDEIMVTMPNQVLCNQECKGICPECGKNLNHDVCDCNSDKIDPRFEALKDFFSN